MCALRVGGLQDYDDVQSRRRCNWRMLSTCSTKSPKQVMSQLSAPIAPLSAVPCHGGTSLAPSCAKWPASGADIISATVQGSTWVAGGATAAHSKQRVFVLGFQELRLPGLCGASAWEEAEAGLSSWGHGGGSEGGNFGHRGPGQRGFPV